jgi:hypothetical protein
VAVRLRRVIGVREEILDWVPEERTRYTRLGAIVVNTAAMAVLSFLVAVHSITSVFWLLLLPFALFWGYLIFSFDGWLISATHGVLGARKLSMFLPRLVVSFLLGFVIAEPLVFQIFQPAIHKQVLDTREQEMSAFEGQLTKCNPVAGDQVADPACKDFLVSVSDSPQTAQAALASLTSQRDKLAVELAASDAKLSQLVTAAADECAGTSGPGLTGVAGDGPECRQDRAAADQYRADQHIDQRQRDLQDLDGKVKEATDKAAAVAAGYKEKVDDAIQVRLRRQRSDQGAIGLLDEEKALDTLAAHNGAVWGAQWLVRLLLVAIDCLPVLAKMAGGTTAYDSCLGRQIEVGRKLHKRHLTTQRDRHIAELEVEARNTRYERDNRLEDIEDLDRSRRAQSEIDKRNRVASLANRLRERGRAG